MKLAVVIPTHQTRELTRRCLASLFAAPGERPEVVVVDDGSTDGTSEAVRAAFPTVAILRNEVPQGFTAAVNRGVGATSEGLVLLLNSDTEVLPGSLAELAAAFDRHPSLGVAGSSLLYPDGGPQWSHGGEPSLTWCFLLASGIGPRLGRRQWWRRVLAWRSPQRADSSYRPVGWVTGAALAFRREVWEAVGPLHEGFLFYGQDLDFCMLARDAGWEIGVVPRSVIVHHHGATIGEVEPAGQVDHQSPALLWRDLVHWAERRGGRRRARRVARALAVGARLRLTARRLTAPVRPGSRQLSWQRADRALSDGLAAIRGVVPKGSPE